MKQYSIKILTGEQSKTQSSIIIIGAGAAGIAAATKLYENGFSNLTILEAQNWYGGRVNSSILNGNILEIGAELCHGSDGNVVFDLASPYKLLKMKDHSLVEYRQNTGNIANTTQTGLLDNLAMHILMASEDVNGSIGAFIEEQ